MRCHCYILVGLINWEFLHKYVDIVISFFKIWINIFSFPFLYFLGLIPNPLLLRTLFSAPHSLYPSFILCTTSFTQPPSAVICDSRYLNNPLPLTARHLVSHALSPSPYLESSLQEQNTAGTAHCRISTLQDQYTAGSVYCWNSTLQEQHTARTAHCRNSTLQEQNTTGTVHEMNCMITKFNPVLFWNLTPFLHVPPLCRLAWALTVNSLIM